MYFCKRHQLTEVLMLVYLQTESFKIVYYQVLPNFYVCLQQLNSIFSTKLDNI